MINWCRLRLALWCTAALLGAQVLAPLLAQWHGVAHGVGHGTPQARPALHAAADATEAHAGGLHDHAPGSAECRLWDHLLLVDAPPVAAPAAVPSRVPAAPATGVTADVQPAPVWGRSARAPPSAVLPS